MPSLFNPVLFTIEQDNKNYLVLDTPNQYWVIPYEDITNLSQFGMGEKIKLDSTDFSTFVTDHNLPVLCCELQSICSKERIDGALEFIPELLEMLEPSTSWSSEFVTRYESLHNGLNPITPSQPLDITVG